MRHCKLLVIYATVDGQSRTIASRIADAARESHADAVVQRVEETAAADLAFYNSIVVVAPVRFGRHLPAMVRFAKANRAALDARHNAFVSVSGSAADPATRAEAERYVDEFVRATGWSPAERLLAGGAVKFTRYNFLLRFVMKRIAASKGQRTDTTRDYEYTDWEAVRRFASSFVSRDAANVA